MQRHCTKSNCTSQARREGNKVATCARAAGVAGVEQRELKGWKDLAVGLGFIHYG